METKKSIPSTMKTMSFEQMFNIIESTQYFFDHAECPHKQTEDARKQRTDELVEILKKHHGRNTLSIQEIDSTEKSVEKNLDDDFKENYQKMEKEIKTLQQEVKKLQDSLHQHWSNKKNDPEKQKLMLQLLDRKLSQSVKEEEKQKMLLHYWKLLLKSLSESTLMKLKQHPSPFAKIYNNTIVGNQFFPVVQFDQTTVKPQEKDYKKKFKSFLEDCPLLDAGDEKEIHLFAENMSENMIKFYIQSLEILSFLQELCDFLKKNNKNQTVLTLNNFITEINRKFYEIEQKNIQNLQGKLPLLTDGQEKSIRRIMETYPTFCKYFQISISGSINVITSKLVQGLTKYKVNLLQQEKYNKEFFQACQLGLIYSFWKRLQNIPEKKELLDIFKVQIPDLNTDDKLQIKENTNPLLETLLEIKIQKLFKLFPFLQKYEASDDLKIKYSRFWILSQILLLDIKKVLELPLEDNKKDDLLILHFFLRETKRIFIYWNNVFDPENTDLKDYCSVNHFCLAKKLVQELLNTIKSPRTKLLLERITDLYDQFVVHDKDIEIKLEEDMKNFFSSNKINH